MDNISGRDGETVKSVEDYKYLGAWISSNLRRTLIPGVPEQGTLPTNLNPCEYLACLGKQKWERSQQQ